MSDNKDNYLIVNLAVVKALVGMQKQAVKAAEEKAVESGKKNGNPSVAMFRPEALTIAEKFSEGR